MVLNGITRTQRFIKGISLHSSIDNNDRRQDTMTGAGTTHDTNSTLFQPLNPGEHIKLDDSTTDLIEINEQSEPCVNIIEEYNLGPLSDPKPFPSYVDINSTKHLDECIKKDIAWSVANGYPGNWPSLGSWTAFNRNVSSRSHEKSIIEYLPVVNQPPDISVCKNYLDNLKT